MSLTHLMRVVKPFGYGMVAEPERRLAPSSAPPHHASCLRSGNQASLHQLAAFTSNDLWEGQPKTPGLLGLAPSHPDRFDALCYYPTRVRGLVSIYR
jgi:hypothetical protein